MQALRKTAKKRMDKHFGFVKPLHILRALYATYFYQFKNKSRRTKPVMISIVLNHALLSATQTHYAEVIFTE